MASLYHLYSPVSDYVMSFNAHFWFLEKFEPKLNPYLICGLCLGGGLLGVAEGILIALLLFFLNCFTWSLLCSYSNPCPLDKTILDILFLWFSLSPSYLFTLSCLSHKVLWSSQLCPLSVMHVSLSYFTHRLVFLSHQVQAGLLANAHIVGRSSPCLFGSPLLFILSFKK